MIIESESTIRYTVIMYGNWSSPSRLRIILSNNNITEASVIHISSMYDISKNKTNITIITVK